MTQTTAGLDATSRRRLVGLVLAGMLLSQLTNTMVSVAVPAMLIGFAVGLERAGWIISAYLLPVAVLMPTWGAAGDLYGRRRTFGLGLAILALGTLVSAGAGSLWLLLIGQFIQAVGASSLQPNGMALLAGPEAGQRRGRILGRLRMLLSLAGIAGAPLGGLLVTYFGWPSIFWATPLLAVGLVGLLARQPSVSPVPAAKDGGFDIAGALTLSLTLLALLAALSLGQSFGWLSLPVLLLAGLALAGLLAIGPIELRQRRPLLAPQLFRQLAFVAVITTGCLQAFACFGTALLGPLLLRSVFQLAADQAGWLLAIFPLGMALSGLPGGWLTDRFGGRWVTLGALLGTVASLGLLALAATTIQTALFVVGALVGGLAAGVGLISMGALTLQVAGTAQHGIAMGAFTMISIAGDIIGVALLPMLLSERPAAALPAAFGQVYLVAAAVALLAILPALAMRPAPLEQATGEPLGRSVA